ncbi:MAG: hypothetical protein DHS20C11_18640 [Lysobacteraceae bacterium]|nr:MAG: hypothetical protein DHS20C11_18640 [Xanthomonadaceae bacterium]
MRKPLNKLRLALYVAACVSLAGLLLLAFGWHGAGSQATETEPLAIDIDKLTIAVGSGRVADERLLVERLLDGGSAIVVMPIGALRTDDYAFFEYVIEGQTSNLEASLVWSPIGAPGELVELVLPTPNGKRQLVRLRGHERWTGNVSQLAIAFFPVPQLSPPLTNIEPIKVESLTFLGGSVIHSAKARLTAWSTEHPWTFRSINYLGGLTADASEGSAMPYLALLGLLCCTLAWVLFRQQARPVIVVTLLTIWFLPDLVWQQGLIRQRAATDELFADASWPDHMQRVADVELVEFAREIKAADSELLQHRVMVSGPSQYLQKRLIWHLSPANSSLMYTKRELLKLSVHDRLVDITGPQGNSVRFANGHLYVAGTQAGQRFRIRAKRLLENEIGTVYEILAKPARVSS